MLESIQTAGYHEKAMVMVTAGWGYPLGEHGLIGPDALLLQELVHTPLIIRFPKARYAGQRTRPVLYPKYRSTAKPSWMGFRCRCQVRFTANSFAIIPGNSKSDPPYAYMKQQTSTAIRTPELAACDNLQRFNTVDSTLSQAQRSLGSQRHQATPSRLGRVPRPNHTENRNRRPNHRANRVSTLAGV